MWAQLGSGQKTGQPTPRWVTQKTAAVSAISVERCPPSPWNGVRYCVEYALVQFGPNHEVLALDIEPVRVERLNARQPTVDAADVARFSTD